MIEHFVEVNKMVNHFEGMLGMFFLTPYAHLQMTNHIKLFTTGFLQVFFVSVNTYFIAHELYVGVLLAAFMISFIWSFNVKKVAFGSTNDRIVYSLGACIGSVFGLWASKSIMLITLFL